MGNKQETAVDIFYNSLDETDKEFYKNNYKKAKRIERKQLEYFFNKGGASEFNREWGMESKTFKQYYNKIYEQ